MRSAGGLGFASSSSDKSKTTAKLTAYSPVPVVAGGAASGSPRGRSLFPSSRHQPAMGGGGKSAGKSGAGKGCKQGSLNCKVGPKNGGTWNALHTGQRPE